MINLYLENEQDFDHNQYVLNETTKATVTETTDGVFDLDLEYPLLDKKRISNKLARKNIIKCPISTTDKRGDQLFTIRKVTKNTKEGKWVVYAQAKARRDLDSNFVIGLKTIPGMTRKQVCEQILNKCVEAHKYHIGNLDTNTNTNINFGVDDETGAIINFIDLNGVSPRKALLGEDVNSVFKAWGGEIIYNNFEINMVDERGTDNTFTIKSGKNLEDLQQDIDDTDTESFVTAVLPCSGDGVYLPNSEIIYSPNHATCPGAFKKIVYDDVILADNTPAAFQNVYNLLREKVQKDFDNGLDKLKINNTINFIQLANTEEYKNYNILEKCEIGNNVIVQYYDPADTTQTPYIEAYGRVISIKFNPLAANGKGKIEEVTIGDRKKPNILTTINATASKASTVDNKANANKAKIKKTAKDSKAYTDDLKVVMEKRADGIELSVTNEAAARVAAIEVLDGEIDERVTTEAFNSEIKIIEGEIDERVTKGDGFGAELKIHFNEITETVYDGTNHNVRLNPDGFHVENGAFDISEGGKLIFRVNPDGSVGLDDLDMLNGKAREADSKFIQFFANLLGMLTIPTLKIGNKLICNSDDFNINNGYDLHDYIKHVIDNG